MKVVILAGGYGTRLAEHTGTVPKPMVEIGSKPIIWHIMSSYAAFGFTDFVVALGYKSEVLKDYFLNFAALQADLKVDLSLGKVDSLTGENGFNWNVTLVDTGLDSMTGGRVARLKPYLENEAFMLTYGDGVCDLNIKALHEFHCTHGKSATITAVHPKAHYGELELEDDCITRFIEKPEFRQSWINGGFMVLEPKIFEYIDGDDTVLEREPFETLASTGDFMAFKHSGFWQCMDTLRDRNYLNEICKQGDIPWLHG